MTHALTLSRPHSASETGLRLVVVVGLVIDAIVHLQLAGTYDLAAPAGIGEGNLFRIEAVAALLVAAAVLLTGSRYAYAAGFLTAGGGLLLLIVYRYFEVPAFGPIPSMYEPLWFGKKTFTAVAQGIAAVAALCAFFVPRQSAERA